LAANASCTFNVAFAPTGSGTKSEAVIVTHNGTGGTTTLNVSGTVAAVDASFASVTALMHMDGANAGTVFTDQRANTVASTGVTTSTTQFKYGTTSAYFNGTQSTPMTVTAAAAAPNGLTMSTGDFTQEAWVYPTAYPTASTGQFVLFGNAPTTGTAYRAITVGVNMMDTGKLRVQSSYDIFLTGTVVVAKNAWTHIAVTRSGTTMRLYVNGVLDVSATNTNDFSAAFPLYVGQLGGGAVNYTGYIDEFRVTKGLARYTSNFTPPTAAFPNQ
jgi:hypothetical protein